MKIETLIKKLEKLQKSNPKALVLLKDFDGQYYNFSGFHTEGAGVDADASLSVNKNDSVCHFAL